MGIELKTVEFYRRSDVVRYQVRRGNKKINHLPGSTSPDSSSFSAFSIYGRHCDSEGMSSSAEIKKYVL